MQVARWGHTSMRSRTVQPGARLRWESGRWSPLSANFGYELDMTRFSADERDEVSAQIALYKEIRSLVQTGDLYQLQSPFESNQAAWIILNVGS